MAACTDTRQLSEDIRKEIGSAYSVQQVAWNLLTQQFNLEAGALAVVVGALEDEEAIVCAAAALLLKANSKGLPPDVRKEAGQKIMKILGDDVLSRRPLDTLDLDVWRLDDVLFEALRVVAE